MPYDSEDAYSGDSRSSGSSSSSDKKGKTRAAAGALKSMGDRETDRANAISSSIRPVAYHSGGRVRKGGSARLLKGERVIPRGKRKKVERLMKREGMRMKSRRH